MDYRAIYIDIKIFDFLTNKVHIPTPLIRTLPTKTLDAVSGYKHNMITCLQQHNILQRIIIIDNKIRKNTLLMEDLPDINELDDIIINSIRKREEKIK